jgi:hypothetical protein
MLRAGATGTKIDESNNINAIKIIGLNKIKPT